jgi:hypothetical protein
MVECPFCKEGDFDLIGLKMHIERHWCDAYEELAGAKHQIAAWNAKAIVESERAEKAEAELAGLRATIARLIELSEKATQGHCVAQRYADDEWYVAYGGPGYGLHIKDSSAARQEDAEFDAALRNWFREHKDELT